MVSIGSRVRRLREAAGLSRAAFAAAVGVRPSKVQDIERGAQRLPSDLAAAVADALGVSLDYLLTGRDVVAEEPAAYSGAPDDPLRHQKDKLKILVEQCDDPDLLDYIQAAVDAMIREERKRRA